MNNTQRKDTQRDIIVDWLIQEEFANEQVLLDACNARFGITITADYWDTIAHEFKMNLSKPHYEELYGEE